MHLKERLESVIREVFRLNEGPLDWSWTSSDISAWDSVGHLNLILALEDAFQVKFEIEEMFELERLNDIEPILRDKKNRIEKKQKVKSKK